MYDYLIYLICIFTALKGFSYGVWSFKNTGAVSGVTVFVISAMCLVPVALIK